MATATETPRGQWSEAQLKFVAGLQDKLERVTTIAKERTDQALNTGVAAAAAASIGYFEGRYPEKNVLGLSPTVAASIAAGGFAVMSKQGSAEERYGMAAATGALSAYAYGIAKAAGEKARIAAAQKKP
ncbi:MAG: hypothetical protein IPK82_23330 [Polyangiaceae bacterium]|nr:hypothetical protein [Polyangiaceae bacterium]